MTKQNNKKFTILPPPKKKLKGANSLFRFSIKNPQYVELHCTFHLFKIGILKYSRRVPILYRVHLNLSWQNKIIQNPQCIKARCTFYFFFGYLWQVPKLIGFIRIYYDQTKWLKKKIHNIFMFIALFISPPPILRKGANTYRVYLNLLWQNNKKSLIYLNSMHKKKKKLLMKGANIYTGMLWWIKWARCPSSFLLLPSMS